ncbi:5796_t:CDS:2 [Acaulospora colombiana]|uniref:5796_t:CDS:1 n=1 Tax=Acaulospora colombiana TaxID=27376 RepID=A0ACA9LX52_9GLOM|nr:5796_t:CDS:2 [Acaulospora colombiana]
MDYSIHLSNVNHSVGHFGSHIVAQANNNNTGRKRARSNSVNKSDQAQVNAITTTTVVTFSTHASTASSSPTNAHTWYSRLHDGS